MHASLIRRQLGGLVPPKIATPKFVSGGSGDGLGPLVNFYSKLPKGAATARISGIKGRFFNGANASGAPLLALIGGLFGIGYTIDYHMHLSEPQIYPLLSGRSIDQILRTLEHHKNHAH
ncbi:MAG: mitochondrial F1-F0 ATP synthase subunit F of fungi-domain-containing protein [Lentinula lateritia]|nr:MAG: mitochondrial F1-F0 ATP synthase subunit F of fungi-domain-containing protein [Lentinula lateritia]